MDELRDRVVGCRIFTKLDLRAGYNLIRIKEGDEWKTAFKSRYGQYEYLVMPFGLVNAPSVFQRMIQGVLQDLLDHGVVVYIDDILIYSKDQKSHDALVREVLTRLNNNKLAVAPHKCAFDVDSVEFLGYIISARGIEMSPGKVQAVQEYEVPKTLKDVRSFLGFANFYRRFIKDFSKIARPITDCLKGGGFQWTPAATAAFEYLKKAFTTAPILIHYDPNQESIVETDASDYALGAILSQRSSEDGKMHPVAFHSRKFSPAEINYDTRDKELLAIVEALKVWRHYLQGTKIPFEIGRAHV